MMWMFRKIAEIFENWIDPLAATDGLRPPGNIGGFFWHYLRQAKMPFVAVLVFGGIGALLEALFFYYVGRLVDILDTANQTDGWSGILATHGGELATMLAIIVAGRFIVAVMSGLVDEQVIARGFYNLIRWQSYLYVARQSLSFFNDQYSGSVVTKVTQAGGALGDFMVGFMQVVWTIIIFTTTTLVLFAQLDWRLAAIIVVWMTIFGFLARYFLPRMRVNATQNAEARAALNGRVVDSYANIQTLKLFGQSEENDQYVHAGFVNFLVTTLRMGRLLIGMRASMTFLSGIMIAAIGILTIDLWSQDLISVGAIAFTLALVLRLNMWLGRLMGGAQRPDAQFRHRAKRHGDYCLAAGCGRCPRRHRLVPEQRSYPV